MGRVKGSGEGAAREGRTKRAARDSNPPDGKLARRTRTRQLFRELGNRTQKVSKSAKPYTGMSNEVLHVG